MADVEADAREYARRMLPEADFQKLLTFVGLCESWGAVSNLVSRADRERLWSRHVADSLQLVDAAAGLGRRWIDLGSGAGFPGLVVGIARPETDMVVVESNRKKAAFLLRAAAVCEGRVRVEPALQRAERPWLALHAEFLIQGAGGATPSAGFSSRTFEARSWTSSETRCSECTRLSDDTGAQQAARAGAEAVRRGLEIAPDSATMRDTLQRLERHG